jgi:hypothetical protein
MKSMVKTLRRKEIKSMLMLLRKQLRSLRLKRLELRLKLLKRLMLRRRGGQRKEMKDHHPLEMMTMFLYLQGYLSRGRRL